MTAQVDDEGSVMTFGSNGTYWTVAAPMLAASAPTSARLYGRVNLGWSDSTGANIGDTSRLNNGQFLISADYQHLTHGSMDNVGTSGILGAGLGSKRNDKLRIEAMLNYRGRYKIKGLQEIEWVN